ncbi:pilus assembly protein [Sphingorhabdus sp.]|uniref:pilus assembly protein n=1 Tax=Sphingorhabdus sp. TaxID=1902408 RepID=UPI0035AEF8E9
MKQGGFARNQQRFLSRIRRDVSGNTIALVAAALVPLTAMIGGGVDVARIYMTKTRLQQACDAGSLAGRKVMGSGVWTTTGTDSAKAQAESYFHANFTDGTYGSYDVEIEYTENEGTVNGQATATLPLVIMQMFTEDEKQLTVSCDAALDLSNTDIMFVLDSTGSMDWCVDGTDECNSGAGSRIAALREAVMAFYDALAPTVSEDSQLRYGFVPYSSSVNVGRILHQANPNWLRTTATYQSRVWTNGFTQVASAWGTPVTDRDSSNPQNQRTGNWTDQSINSAVNSRNACNALASPADSAVQAVGSPQVTNYNSSVDDGTGVRTVTYTETQSYRQYQYRYRWSSNRCWLQRREYTYVIETDVTEVSQPTAWTMVPSNNAYWVYGPTTYDVSAYIATINGGAAVTTQTGNSGGNVTSTWNGCIEERQTVSENSFSPPSADAYDLDLNMVPTSDDATKWTPAWSNITYLRQNQNSQNVTTSNQTRSTYSRANHYCPHEAMKLGEYDRDEVEDYVDSLVAVGSTYHDMGMIWGGRLLSPIGLFASENAYTASGDTISRHLVFMTDGELAPSTSLYGLYGVEYLDRRVTGAAGTGVQFNRHEDRFLAICQAVRNMNVTIWIVGLGTELSDAMYECAGETRDASSHVYESESADDLIDNFRRIAGDIAALRLES